jgi:hypothetical protein
LVEAIGLPTLMLLVILVTGMTVGGWSGWPVRIAMLVTGVVAFVRCATLLVEKPPDAKTPVGQRRSVLRRVTRPVELIAVLIALALVAVSLFLLLLTMIGVRATLPVLGAPLSHVHPVLFFVGFLVTWIFVNALDWHNDIDQVRVPLLYSQRTEARLDQVQNVTAAQDFLGGLLGYGNVVVETAGRTQSVVFEQVSRPQQIQRVIFDRLELLHARREAEQRSREEDRLADWFSVYHELAARVDVVSARTQVRLGSRLRVGWKVSAPADLLYDTFLVWDTESHRDDNAYARSTPPIPGSGPGWYADWIVPEQAGRVYLKACIRPRNGTPPYSSEEHGVQVVA